MPEWPGGEYRLSRRWKAMWLPTNRLSTRMVRACNAVCHLTHHMHDVSASLIWQVRAHLGFIGVHTEILGNMEQHSTHRHEKHCWMLLATTTCTTCHLDRQVIVLGHMPYDPPSPQRNKAVTASVAAALGHQSFAQNGIMHLDANMTTSVHHFFPPPKLCPNLPCKSNS